MQKSTLEKKYGIYISDDSYYSSVKGRMIKAYKFYSADGCPWENGFHTLKDVEAECEKWKKELLSIKAKSLET